MEYVTLVNDRGLPIGRAEKLAVHQGGGQLHMAFSIFVFNHRNELLLQKRASGKYHFSDRWSNTCCGHPRPNEVPKLAAKRRLKEEFGFSTILYQCFSLTYEVHDEKSNLTEKEYSLVFSGCFNGKVYPDGNEIDDWQWCSIETILDASKRDPDDFTPWFCLLLDRLPNILECASSEKW